MGVSRQHPFVSPLGCGSAILLVIGVGVAALLSGGKQFNPGDLSEVSARASGAGVRPVTAGGFKSHAEFESDCRQCHVPFLGVEAARCEQCHTAVADERATGTGLHGSAQLGDTARCQDCHREHKGRSFDTMADARGKFNHTTLSFTLDQHWRDYALAPLAQRCDACHTGVRFAVEATACTLCHGAHDQLFMLDHTEAFGNDCMACHDGIDKMATFDHGRTTFTLDGWHTVVACAGCHTAAVDAKNTPTECQACHAEPEAHLTMFGTNCAECHTAAGWSPATLNNAAFDHASTGFALTSHKQDYDSTPFTCRTCHASGGVGDVANSTYTFDQQTCVDCHTTADAGFMTEHTQRFGVDCLSCHDGSGNMKNFDHNNVFPLDGQHAALECQACHVNNQFKGTSSECVACHAEPQIHAGLFGANCVACHTAAAWTPARLTQHTFPLDHGESGEIPCATCHTDNYTTYTCYGCHEHDPAKTARKHAEEGIRGERLQDCFACHATGKSEEGEE